MWETLGGWGIVIVSTLFLLLILGLTNKMAGVYIKEVLISMFSTKKVLENDKNEEEPKKN